MKQRPEERRRSSVLLVRALAANAVFSGLSGLALLLAAGWLGVPEPWILRALGAGLVAFAAGLALLARSARPRRDLVLAASVSDFAWVAGSAWLLVGFPDLLTSAGEAAVAVVAVLVAVLGAAQLVGLREWEPAGEREPSRRREMTAKP